MCANTFGRPSSRKLWPAALGRLHSLPMTSRCQTLSFLDFNPSFFPSGVPDWFSQHAMPSKALSRIASPSTFKHSHQQDRPCGLTRAQWCGCTRPRRAVPPLRYVRSGWLVVFQPTGSTLTDNLHFQPSVSQCPLFIPHFSGCRYQSC